MKTVANNKKATYEYFILDTFEAGIVLHGTEIKSVNNGKVNIDDAYITVDGTSTTIIGMNISPFENGNIFNHEAKRNRQLLLHKKEMLKISQKLKEDNLTVIPLSVFLNDNGKAKIKIALAKGKKKYDKRESIKKRDIDRKIQRGDY